MTEWKVPLAAVDLGAEELDAIAQVVRSKWLTMGPMTATFEEEFARCHSAQHAIAVANGTAALHLAYLVTGLSPGDEVIMPSITFVATASAAVACGAQPVFADIRSDEDPTIDPEHVESLITARSRAIVVVHYAGYPCRMDKVMSIASRHGLSVIEDCAHAPGVRYDGRHLGSFGDAGCFSLFSNKNITTAEGGVVVTASQELASRIRLLRSHGMSSGTWDRHANRPADYDVLEFGWNYRIDEIRSAIGLVQLAKLAGANRRRTELLARYREAFRCTSDVRVPFGAHTGEAACHILPIVISESIDRAKLVAGLARAGIQTSRHYTPVHQLQAYREKYRYKAGMLPVSESFARREITLPLYSGLKDEDVEYVATTVTGLLADCRQPAFRAHD